MSLRRIFLGISVIVLALLLLGSAIYHSKAAVFWASANGEPLLLGVRTNPISVCFVGNAVDQRPDRVQEIVTHLKEFEHAANIDFVTVDGLVPLAEAAQNDILSLKCPLAATQTNGWDYYEGDIRVLLRYTDVDWNAPTPGIGCFNDALRDEPDAALWSTGRVDVFWRGTNGVLRHKYWINLGVEQWGESFLEELGGSLTSGPGATAWATGKLIVFARGLDGGLWYIRYDGINWGTWQSLGGQIIGSPDAVSWGTDRIDVFVRWSDDSLRHRWSTDGGLNWSGWENLSGTLASAPGTASWAANRLIVFARGQDDGLWYRRFDGSSWSDWLTSGGSLAGAPDASSWGSNRIDVVVRWNDDTLRQLTSTDAGLNWGNWLNWNGQLKSDPSIVAVAANRMQVYFQGVNTSLWQRIWIGGAWDPAQDQGVNGNDGSYSNPPWELDLPNRRACLFNLKLGDDPWSISQPPYLNHTLHEFGHALGLSHEHQRYDVNAGCTENGYGSSNTNGLMTPYDRNSVMHYKFASCNINGNYDYTGLSAWDKLALHILYPEDVKVAEYIGITVIKAGSILSLQSTWQARGANMSFVAGNFNWKLNGTLSSTTPELVQTMSSPGVYQLQIDHDDFLGRHYTSTGLVRVLDDNEYTDTILAPSATTSVLLLQTVTSTFLPIIVLP